MYNHYSPTFNMDCHIILLFKHVCPINYVLKSGLPYRNSCSSFKPCSNRYITSTASSALTYNYNILFDDFQQIMDERNQLNDCYTKDCFAHLSLSIILMIIFLIIGGPCSLIFTITALIVFLTVNKFIIIIKIFLTSNLVWTRGVHKKEMVENVCLYIAACRWTVLLFHYFSFHLFNCFVIDLIYWVYWCNCVIIMPCSFLHTQSYLLWPLYTCILCLE